MAGGGVFRPPYAAAVGLAGWHINNGPWVRGACLIRGVDPDRLTASNLLDITHYLLEEDSLRGIAMAEDPADTVAKMRAGIYRNLYKRSHETGTAGDIEAEDGVLYATADGTHPREIKPFVPPTEMTENDALPFGNVVGAPLGF